MLQIALCVAAIEHHATGSVSALACESEESSSEVKAPGGFRKAAEKVSNMVKAVDKMGAVAKMKAVVKEQYDDFNRWDAERTGWAVVREHVSKFFSMEIQGDLDECEAGNPTEVFDRHGIFSPFLEESGNFDEYTFPPKDLCVGPVGIIQNADSLWKDYLGNTNKFSVEIVKTMLVDDFFFTFRKDTAAFFEKSNFRKALCLAVSRVPHLTAEQTKRCDAADLLDHLIKEHEGQRSETI